MRLDSTFISAATRTGRLAAFLMVTAAAVFAQPVPLQLGTSAAVEPGPNAVEAVEFTPNLDALRAAPQELLLALPGGSQLVLVMTSFEDRGNGDLLWRGQVPVSEGSMALFTVTDGFLTGAIKTRSDSFEIRIRGGREMLERMGPARSFRDDLILIPPADAAKAAADRLTAAAQPELSTTGESEIDVLAVYTTLALAHAGSEAAMQASVQAMVDYANTVFVNSNVAARYRLVGVQPGFGPFSSEATVWSGNFSPTHFSALQSTHKADIIVQIVRSPPSPISNVCGQAPATQSMTPFAQGANQITVLTCPIDVFAHENGHILGMLHDPANSGGYVPQYPWSYGHLVPGVFNTVMAYGNLTIPHFSNPDISYMGHPTGIINERDNARTARINAPIVAAFQAGIPTPTAAPATPALSNAVAEVSPVLQVRVLWSDVEQEFAYEIERSLDGVNFGLIGTAAANVTSYFDLNVSAPNTYHYRVRAANILGKSGYTPIRTVVMPVPPAPPSNLTATPEGATEIRLNWTDGSTNEAGFVIELLIDGSYQPFDEVGPNATSYIFRFGQPSTPFSFRVYARTDFFDSAPSNVASATTLATNPGIIAGFAFNDPNKNGRPDVGETPAVNLVVYYDANRNGLMDVGERSVTIGNSRDTDPKTGLPILTAPNYQMNQLPVGSRSICASFTPAASGKSICKTVSIRTTSQNVDFPVTESKVGIASLTPQSQIVKNGDKVAFNVHWAHTEGKWVLLKDAVVRFAEVDQSGAAVPGDPMQIRFEESTRQFSLDRTQGNGSPQSFPAGSSVVLQTADAEFHLADTQMIGSGPAGPSVTLKLVLSFKPRTRGKTLRALIQLTDDNGYIQGFDQIGTVTVQ
jgi:hypothetical protein